MPREDTSLYNGEALKPIVTAAGALSCCTKAVFPSINTLLHILTVLSVMTAEPERVLES